MLLLLRLAPSFPSFPRPSLARSSSRKRRILRVQGHRGSLYGREFISRKREGVSSRGKKGTQRRVEGNVELTGFLCSSFSSTRFSVRSDLGSMKKVLRDAWEGVGVRRCKRGIRRDRESKEGVAMAGSGLGGEGGGELRLL